MSEPAPAASDRVSADAHQGARGVDATSDGLPVRFGKYTLLRRLATGGMAELFLAIQRSVAGFEKLIVIKRILPAMNQDKAFIEMLLHEARIAATLSHPNVVQIFDVGCVDGAYFIAMEHVHGEDLRSIVRQMKRKEIGEFPLEHALGIAIGMCAGLAHAHEKRDLDGTPLNIVHRDISPQNVVVAFTGDVKVVDFGIAKSDAKQHVGGTKSGKLKGKVPYMSPEQARGEAVDWRSDIFAVGVMLFELTTGKRLFKGPSEFETLKLICERDYPAPSAVRGGYPPELEIIVMRALAKDRQHRWQSAREMQAALEEFARGEKIPVSTIALSAFMQRIFEEKLVLQKEALQQGKQLADVLARALGESSGGDVNDRPSMSDLETSTSTGLFSTPAAARTVTGLAAPRRRRRPLIVAAIAGSLVAASFAGGAWMWARSRAQVHAFAPAAAAASVTRHDGAHGALRIDSDPPGAAIWIDGDLRTEVTPATVVDLPLARALDVKLTKDGYAPSRETVTLAGASTGVHLALKEVPHPLPPPERVRVTSARVTAPRAAAATPAKDPVGVGKLNVSASGGWCNIAVDGAGRGPTPVAGIELAAGPHKVTCASEGKPIQAATVTIEKDGTARHRFALEP